MNGTRSRRIELLHKHWADAFVMRLTTDRLFLCTLDTATTVYQWWALSAIHIISCQSGCGTTFETFPKETRETDTASRLLEVGKDCGWKWLDSLTKHLFDLSRYWKSREKVCKGHMQEIKQEVLCFFLSSQYSRQCGSYSTQTPRTPA